MSDDLGKLTLVDLVRLAAEVGSDFDLEASTRLMLEARRRDIAYADLLAAAEAVLRLNDNYDFADGGWDAVEDRYTIRHDFETLRAAVARAKGES